MMSFTYGGVGLVAPILVAFYRISASRSLVSALSPRAAAASRAIFNHQHVTTR